MTLDNLSSIYCKDPVIYGPELSSATCKASVEERRDEVCEVNVRTQLSTMVGSADSHFMAAQELVSFVLLPPENMTRLSKK